MHKDAKGEACSCRINADHNTKPSPHKDREGRMCSGPFVFETGASAVLGRRFCSWCRRVECYSHLEIVVIFRKGISAAQAFQFLMETKIADASITVVRRLNADGQYAIVEKDGLVSITVSIPSSSAGPDVWIQEFEKHQEVVYAAIRVMLVLFSDSEHTPLPAKTAAPRRKSIGNLPEEFPGL